MARYLFVYVCVYLRVCVFDFLSLHMQEITCLCPCRERTLDMARYVIVCVPVCLHVCMFAILFLHIQEEISKYDKICEESYMLAKKETAVSNAEWLDSPWTDFFSSRGDQMKIPSTSVNEDVLLAIGDKVSTVPENFQVHGGKKTMCL